MKIVPPKNSIHFGNRMLCGRCRRSARRANKGVMSAQNKNECVNPRCANKLEVVLSQVAAVKSISGILCAMAPHSIAFLPKVLPAKASPMQAPSARWVRESIMMIDWQQYQLNRAVCNDSFYFHHQIYLSFFDYLIKFSFIVCCNALTITIYGQ